MSFELPQNTLNTLLEYTRILDKKRISLAEEEVREIIAHEKNIVAAINQIKAVDEKYEKLNLIPREAEEDNRAISKNLDKNIESQVQEISKNRTLSLKRTPFFKYWFTQRLKLKKLCHETSVLSPRFFCLEYQISDESLSLLSEISSQLLSSMIPLTHQILDTGWKVLTPETYNLFYHFFHFASGFVAQFILEKSRISKNFVFVESFSKDYLTIARHENSLHLMREGIHLLSRENRDIRNHPASTEMMVFLENLYSRRRNFSFLNYLLMVYSAFYRRVFTLEEIFNLKEIEPVSHTRFSTSQRIRQMIQEYIAHLKDRQKANEKKLFFLKQIPEEKPELLLIFLRSVGEKSLSESSFSDHLLKTSAIFLSRFIAYSSPILKGQVFLRKEGALAVETPIFVEVWDSLLSGLSEKVQAMESLMKSYPNLSVSRSLYDRFNSQQGRLASEKEEKACTLIRMAGAHLNDLLETLSQFLYQDYYLTYHEDKKNILDRLDSRKEPMSRINQPQFIPFSDYQCESYQDTVLSVLNKIAEIAGSYLYGIHFKGIHERLQEKNTLIWESKRNADEMARLSG